MKTDASKKASAAKVASQEQKENVKNIRKTLKVLQHTATDKENLTGRPKIEKILENEKLQKSKQYANKAVQTGESIITAEDLISDEPSLDYWKTLAEKRGEALNESLHENDKLKEQIENLTQENEICKEMLEESKHLVEVLQEMLGDSDTSQNSTEIAEEAVETCT